MELINLPVLPNDTSLRAALAVLRGVSLSGLVTVRHDDVLLVRAGDLYKAIGLQKNSIGEAPSTSVDTQFVVRNPVFKHGLRWTITVGPTAKSQRIGERGMQLMSPPYFEPPQVPPSDYTLAAMDVGVATILTASEEYADQMEGQPTSCYCTGPRQHGYPRQHPQLCTFEQYSIECGP